MSQLDQIISFNHIIQTIRSTFSNLPDMRKKGNHQKYAIEDAALSAFSVFFTQSPSFLDYQTRMKKEQGKSNVQTIFGAHEIPSTPQIGNMLDPISPREIYPIFKSLLEPLYSGGHFESLRSVANTITIALDGVQHFSSKKISCECCSQKQSSEGVISYQHSAVTPVIVKPGSSQVIPLAPEFIEPQDGEVKQDCELNASKRWLNQWGADYSSWGVTLLGDDLYCNQPFSQAVLDQGMHFIWVCKASSHPILYEWLADFERSGEVNSVTQQVWNGRQRLTYGYRYFNHLPLRDGDDALMVNWCELTITNAKGQLIYHNTWVTSHTITDLNVAAIVAAGRARWHIENGNNNTLKNQGYHFEHNFAHGKKHLANLLATLNILAYLVHTLLDLVDACYRKVRQSLPSRRTFFEHLRALMHYVLFDSWDQLMLFMMPSNKATQKPSG